MTKGVSYPKAFGEWRESWQFPLRDVELHPLTWHVVESAWNAAIRFAERAVRVDEDGCLQCPDCQQEVKAVVKCEITGIPVIWDRKQESFDYSTLDGEIIDNDITEWFCRNCGWKAQDPPMIDMQTLQEL